MPATYSSIIAHSSLTHLLTHSCSSSHHNPCIHTYVTYLPSSSLFLSLLLLPPSLIHPLSTFNAYHALPQIPRTDTIPSRSLHDIDSFIPLYIVHTRCICIYIIYQPASLAFLPPFFSLPSQRSEIPSWIGMYLSIAWPVVEYNNQSIPTNSRDDVMRSNRKKRVPQSIT